MEIVSLPRDLTPELGTSEDHFAPRPISMEEAFGRQNDRIGYLRSVGLPWAEAVYQLRDLLVGIEDEEFWDGIPPEERAKLAKLPPLEQEQVAKRFAAEGWSGYPCRAVQVAVEQPDGSTKWVTHYTPTPENLSHAYRIVMRLAARRGLSWRTRRVSRLSPKVEAE